MNPAQRPVHAPQIEPMSPAILITAFICLAFILGIAANKFIFQASKFSLSAEQRLQIESGLNFPPLQFDKARQQAAHREFYETPDLSTQRDTVQALHDLTQKANLTQFPPLDGESLPPLAELDHHLRLLADELLPATGPRGFSSVGEPLFQACTEGLNDLLAALQAQELPLSQALKDPPHQRFAQYRKNCGNALPVLLERHLITPDGTWAHDFGPELFGILQRYRWADLIHSRYSTDQQLAPYDLEIFSRWRIEDPQAFSPAERRQLLAQSRAYLPTDYDHGLARVRIEAANQDLSAAAVQLGDLIHENPENPVYSAIFQDLERQLRLGMR